ncbi:putative virion structural protein [Salmonella phage SPFM9]|nr:putative virion structural protein [Salmonella phage SPFM9]
MYVGSTTDDGTASGDDPKKLPELWVASDEPADYNLKGANVQAKGVIAGDSAFPVELNKVGQGYIYSYGVDCTAIAAFLKVVTQTKLDGLVYPDGPSEAKVGSIPVKIGAKPQVGERLSLDPDPAPVDHVITFKEDCYAYHDIVPAAIPENTNPPLTNPNETTTDLLTTLNTQYGLKLTEGLEGSALFRNVTAYLDVKLPMTLTAKKNSGYIGTQDVTYNQITLGTPTPISDEGADRNTSNQLVLDFINEKNPDAELELSNDPD